MFIKGVHNLEDLIGGLIAVGLLNVLKIRGRHVVVKGKDCLTAWA
jgi:hypothetical protein